MRVATIDIGTNTTLMLIAERRDDDVVSLEDHMEITRLGKGVDRTRHLDEQAIACTLAALERFAARARELSVAKIAVVATSASRDADNGPDFLERAASVLGIDERDVSIASGGREAELTFRGALGGLGLAERARVAVIDVGGGSTEIVIGSRAEGVEWSHSFDVGSVRLTERHVHADPPASTELAAVREDVARTFASRAIPAGPFAAVVAIAGTATTFAAIDKKLVRYADAPPHGHVLSLATLDAIIGRLAATPLDERRRTVGLEPKRADVIVAGGLVLRGALTALSTGAMVVSDRGVRWGLALELLDGAH
jgi:exopolyphosphatase/guanosine-5'-triphosphate,3'-diphosphate pyrophosphatase